MLEAASTAALTAGFTPEQINDAAGEEYPPVGANPEWLKGYEAAAEGRVVAPATSNEYEGYMAWLRRHG